MKPPTWRAWKARNSSERWYWRAPLAVEWALEWFVYRLRGLALFDLLELAGRCTVLVVAIFWLLEADNRAKERHYRAWDLINAARGSTADGGCRDALQDLNSDGVSLARAPLEQANLPWVDLNGADLEGADLGGAFLEFANLQGAFLTETNLQDANLRGADLQGAGGAMKLRSADLWGANLRGADLRNAENLTQEQLDVAIGDDQTRLPDGLTRPAHWTKADEPEAPPAPQPDAAGRAPPAGGAPGSGK